MLTYQDGALLLKLHAIISTPVQSVPWSSQLSPLCSVTVLGLRHGSSQELSNGLRFSPNSKNTPKLKLHVSSSGLPKSWLSGKEDSCQVRRRGRLGFDPSGLPEGQEEPLEEEMATQSSTLVWKIPWTEEPGGLQSLGSQRGRHNQATEHTHNSCPSQMIEPHNMPAETPVLVSTESPTANQYRINTENQDGMLSGMLETGRKKLESQVWAKPGIGN